MEITTLGVGIDPSKAVSGAATAVKAAESMASGMNAAGIKAEKAEKGVGAAGTDMGRKVQEGADKAGNAATRLASNSAWSRLRASLAGMAGGITGTFSSIGKAVLTLGSAFGALQAAMLPIMALVGTLKAGFSLLAGAINGAADFEDYNIQWAQLLGSFDQARDKMEMLSDIAAKTPFNLPEIVKGAIGLQTLSQGLLTTRENLLLVGDAAAKAKQPFDVMSDTLGRIYVNAKYGGEIIEQLKTILSQGIISGDTFAKIKELGGTEANEGGKNFVKIWGLLEAELAKAKNSMLLMSEATNGLFSTLSDGWAEFQRTFGAALNVGVRPLVRALTDEIGDWTEKAKELAPEIEAAALSAAAFVNALRDNGGFTLAMKAAWEEIKAYALQIINTLGDVLKNRFEIAAFALEKQFNELKTPEFWKGMSEQLTTAANEFVNVITLGLSNATQAMKSDLEKIGTGIANGNGSLIMEGLVGASPREPRFPQGLTKQPNAGALLLLPKAPTMLGVEDAWKNNATGESPELTDLKLRIEAQKKLIELKNGQSTDSALLYKPNEGPQLPPSIPFGANDGPQMDEATKKARAGLTELENLAKRVIESTRTPYEEFAKTMEQLQTLQQKGLLTGEQYNRAATQASDKYAESVKAAAEATKRAAFEQLSPLQQLMTKWRDLNAAVGQASVEIAGSISSNMSDALTDMITGASSVKDAFQRMTNSIISDLVRQATQMLINYAIQRLVGLVGGAFGGGAGAAAGTAIAGVNHAGGVVGESGWSRSVPASSFRNAPKFQHGGTVTSGERAIIAEPGEEVLTRSQSKDIKERLGAKKAEPASQSVNIVNVVSPELFEQYVSSNNGAILNVIAANARQVKRMIA